MGHLLAAGTVDRGIAAAYLSTLALLVGIIVTVMGSVLASAFLDGKLESADETLWHKVSLVFVGFAGSVIALILILRYFFILTTGDISTGDLKFVSFAVAIGLFLTCMPLIDLIRISRSMRKSEEAAFKRELEREEIRKRLAEGEDADSILADLQQRQIARIKAKRKGR